MHTGTITTWAGVITSLTLFIAQNTRDTAAQTQPAQRGGAKVESLAAWLALGNHAEIELSKVAVERSTNPDVKAFANKMIEDHTAFLGELKKFMPALDEQGAAAQPGEPRTLPAQRPGADQPQQPQRQTQQQQLQQEQQQQLQQRPQQAEHARDSHGEMLQIATKAAQIKLAMTKQMLEKYQGQDFDMAYLGQQIVAHTDMLAVMQAMKGHGTPEFQQLLEQGMETVKHHLTEAHALAKRLEDRESPSQEVKTPVRERTPDQQ